MTLHPYNLISGATTLALYLWLPRGGIRAIWGSVIVGLIWPVLIPMGLYFGTKVKILRLPFRSDWVLALELTGCLLVAMVGLTIYLLQGVS